MDHTEQWKGAMNFNNRVTEKAMPYYDPKGGAARTAVIAQSPEVKTTKKHSHDSTVSKPIQNYIPTTLQRNLWDLADTSD
jgi:hypothetical protein